MSDKVSLSRIKVASQWSWICKICYHPGYIYILPILSIHLLACDKWIYFSNFILNAICLQDFASQVFQEIYITNELSRSIEKVSWENACSILNLRQSFAKISRNISRDILRCCLTQSSHNRKRFPVFSRWHLCENECAHLGGNLNSFFFLLFHLTQKYLQSCVRWYVLGPYGYKEGKKWSYYYNWHRKCIGSYYYQQCCLCYW